MTTRDEIVQRAANRLWAARRAGIPCAPVRDLIGSDPWMAYEVARVNLTRSINDGARRAGWKIGLTSTTVQTQLGITNPDYGTLFDSMRIAPGGHVPPGVLMQPRVEAEVAFVMSADATGPLDGPDDLARSVEGAKAAIEIVDSRITRWDLTFADTVADNASSAMFVVSDTVVPLAAVVPADVSVLTFINGNVASEGNGRMCMDDPLLAVLWLARTLRDLGEPLLAGDVVLSGALGPPMAVQAGDVVDVEFTGLGGVRVTFDR